MQSVTQPKKNTTQTTTKQTPTRTNSTDNNDFTEKTADSDKQNYQGEGDEREWQTPDVKPKYPTDVQASANTTQGETADYAMSQDDEDGVIGTETPGLMNRH